MTRTRGMRRSCKRASGISLFFFLLLPALTSGQTAPSRALITQPVDEAKLTILRGNTHPLARPEFDRGAAPPSLPMERMLLVLKRSAEQQVALDTLVDEQQDKASPNFHKWLTPEQFGEQFGPSDEDIHTVTAWLQSHGFQAVKVAKGRVVIEFSGTAGLVQEAFRTTIHKYVIDGAEHWANASDPQVPAALAPLVAGPLSLHNFRKHSNLAASIERATFQRTSSGDVNLTNNQGQHIHALGPADLATIYNIPNFFSSAPIPLNGGGITIGVVARSNINPADIGAFRNIFDVGGTIKILLNGVDPGNLGGLEEVEAVLDTSWAGAAAPQAEVTLVVSQSTETTDGTDLSEIYIIDNNLADVMTESFGSCEQDVTPVFANAEATLAEQAAAQGITFMASSGDSGAVCSHTNSKTIATQIPASLPFVTAVGGTMFTANDSSFWNATNNPVSLESAKSYIPENVWNETISGKQAASGGGISTLFAAPPWQTGVSGLGATPNRQVPDVSLNAAANHDPYIICVQDMGASCSPGSGVILVGGTSASTPSFAGIMALVNYSQFAQRQGEAGYVLYKLAAAEQASPTFAQCNASALPSGPSNANCVFNDVTQGNNVITGEAGSTTEFQAGPAYDLATGLGSVNVANLINAWGGARTTGSATTISAVTAFPIAHGQPATFTIKVSPQTGTANPTGMVSLIADTGPFGFESVGSFSLTNGSVTAATSSLPGGQYTVTAHYEGDGTFTPSDSSNIVNVKVLPETSSIQIELVLLDINTGQITNNIPSAAYGANDALRVNISAGQSGACARSPFSLNCPTGSVAITANSQPLDGGTFTLNSLGYAEDQSANASLTPGTYQLSSSYSGDGSFNPSGPAADTVMITQATSTTTVTPNPSAIVAGGTVTLTATVNTQSFGRPPTGTVTFFSGGAQLGNPVAVTGGFSRSFPGFALATASLTTMLSNVPAPMDTSRRKPNVQVFALWFAACFAILWLLLCSLALQRKRHHGYVYAALALALLLAGGMAACGGGGGGGGNQHTDTITATFSGDSNYSSSTSAGVSVTIH